MSNLYIPEWLRAPIYGMYSKMFNCNMEEADEPDFRAYPTMGQFFYRALKPGTRHIDPESPLVSPADGQVLYYGMISERKIEHIKGITYSVDALLGHSHALEVSKEAQVASEEDFAEINTVSYSLDRMLGSKNQVNGHIYGHDPQNGLYFYVIYLAPGDYHRFHSPAEWTVHRRRHFAGELFSVAPWMLESIKNLFVLNERVALLGKWAHGFFSMVPVGATNVGSIKINFDPVSFLKKINVIRNSRPIMW
jgi:phosphatidylserine decarboxylase